MRRLLFLLFISSPLFAATPIFVPDRDEAIVERLPSGTAATRRDLTRQRSAPEAVAAARRHVERARRDGDPRFLGYAETALAAWQDRADAPAAVLLMRATIAQSRHAFVAALTDLDRVVRLEPNDVQAGLTRATIYQVQGRYADSRAECRRIAPRVAPAVAAACEAGAAASADELAAAYADLQRHASAPHIAPDVRGWLAVVAAETADRLGRAQDAEANFIAALQFGRDSYALTAYADFLLRADRADDVLRLLADHRAADGLLLRYAIAAAKRGRADAPALSADLAERFDAARRRSDATHGREEAMFELLLKHDADRAVAAARANWQVQREAADLRIYAAAAQAANDAAAKREIAAWRRANRHHDVVADRLGGQS